MRIVGIPLLIPVAAALQWVAWEIAGRNGLVPLWDMGEFRVGIVHFPRIVVPRIGAYGVAIVDSNTALDLDRGSTQGTLVDAVVEGASKCWKPFLDRLGCMPVRAYLLSAYS